MRLAATAVLIACAAASTGCGREPSAMTPAPAAAPQEATVRAGDITVRASTIQTSMLGDAVARQYGIARGDSTVLLLVAVRKGAEADETSVPATITATATDLRGRQQSVPMKELRSGDLLDYTGLVDVGAPETVRFELSVVPDGGTPIAVRFTRDFFPN
ncbi:MAG: DUF4426 domain-containing protein [Pseudomonas sp.]|nr:DUF4426 domain-containing protein [Pseudomonas sp.]